MVSFQDLQDRVNNNLKNNLENTAWNLEHNAKFTKNSK